MSDQARAEHGSGRGVRLLATLVVALSSAHCSSSDDASPDPSGAGTGGTGQSAAGGQAAPENTGGTALGGMPGAGAGGASGTAGTSASDGGTAGTSASDGGTAGTSASDGGTAGTSASDGGAAGTSASDGGAAGASASDGGAAGDVAAGNDFDEVGVCGHRGEATVSGTEFSGFEEYFLIGEEGFGSDICVVRFDVERSGDAPAGCTDCEWSHRVTLSNPTVVLDTNGVCGRSELGFDAEKIAEIDGSEAAYGYVNEFAGHASVLMKYDEEQSLWDAFGSATFDAETQALEFERRNGFCNY